MGFIEILVVFGILYVLYATELIGPQNILLWIIIAAVTWLIVFFLFHLLTKGFGRAFIGEGRAALRKQQRRLKIAGLLREKKYAEAETFLRELLQRDPADNEASRALCDILFSEKRYEEFIIEKERFLREGYRVPVHEKTTAYNRIADLYLTYFHNLDRALMALNQIVLDFPDTKEAAFARKRMSEIAERMQKERDMSDNDP
jgi:tetratricopeptide (TPR) repeat protein